MFLRTILVAFATVQLLSHCGDVQPQALRSSASLSAVACWLAACWEEHVIDSSEQSIAGQSNKYISAGCLSAAVKGL